MIDHNRERRARGLPPLPGTAAEQRQAAADHDMRVEVVKRELDQCPAGCPTALVAERVLYAINAYDDHLAAKQRAVPRPTDRTRAYRLGYWLGVRFWSGVLCLLAGATGWYMVELMRR